MVTLNYRPDKNYLDSLGLEDNNLQEEIEVEQVKPDSGVTPDPGSDVKEGPEDPDNPDDPDYDPAKPSVNVDIDGDDVPVGIEPITDSFKVILADGHRGARACRFLRPGHPHTCGEHGRR